MNQKETGTGWFGSRSRKAQAAPAANGNGANGNGHKGGPDESKIANRVEIKLTRYQSIRKGMTFEDYLKVKQGQEAARAEQARF